MTLHLFLFFNIYKLLYIAGKDSGVFSHCFPQFEIQRFFFSYMGCHPRLKSSVYLAIQTKDRGREKRQLYLPQWHLYESKYKRIVEDLNLAHQFHFLKPISIILPTHLWVWCVKNLFFCSKCIPVLFLFLLISWEDYFIYRGFILTELNLSSHMSWCKTENSVNIRYHTTLFLDKCKENHFYICFFFLI